MKDFNFINSHATIIEDILRFFQPFVKSDRLKTFIADEFHQLLCEKWFPQRFTKRDLLFETAKHLLTDGNEYRLWTQTVKLFKKQIMITDQSYDCVFNSVKIDPNKRQQLIKRSVKYKISPNVLKQRLNIIKNFRSPRKHPIKQFVILEIQHLNFIQKNYERIVLWMTEPYQWRWAKFLPFDEFRNRMMFVINDIDLFRVGFFDHVFAKNLCASLLLMFDCRITSQALTAIKQSKVFDKIAKRSKFIKILIDVFNNM